MLSILILNYNSQRHLKDCLDSLLAQDYSGDFEIVLVDNASTDGSVAWVEANYPTVKVVRNGANLGFAEGNNAGARAVNSAWIAILNPDTRAEPNWLTELTRPLQDPTVTCVASRMLSWDGRQLDFADAALNFMGWGCQPAFQSRDLSLFSESKQIIFACGGAMLVHRQTFLEAGGFDPDYFAYFEDVDFGWRLNLQGGKIISAPRAIVYHRHHGSWDGVNEAKTWLLAERNTLWGLIKNYSDATLAYTLPAALLLLLRRVYLDIRPDEATYGPITPAGVGSGIGRGIGRPFGPAYYLREAANLLKQGDLKQLAHRTQTELSRRLNTPAPRPAPPPPRSSTATAATAIPLGRLLAARDIAQSWERTLAKRATVQAQRRVPDPDLFPLFQWALISNFGDDDFLVAFQQVVGKFGLVELFQSAAPPTVPPDHFAQSLEAAQALLAIATAVFETTRAHAADFRIGPSTPQASYTIPPVGVARLAQVNRLLWSLPAGPLSAQLAHILTGCTAVLKA